MDHHGFYCLQIKLWQSHWQMMGFLCGFPTHAEPHTALDIHLSVLFLMLFSFWAYLFALCTMLKILFRFFRRIGIGQGMNQLLLNFLLYPSATNCQICGNQLLYFPQYPFLSHITSKLARLAAAANLTSDVNTTAFYISDFILFYMYITIYIQTGYISFDRFATGYVLANLIHWGKNSTVKPFCTKTDLQSMNKTIIFHA